MKVSVSLSEAAAAKLTDLAQEQGTSTSAVVESAVRKFAELSSSERHRWVLETETEKLSNPGAWRRVFWRWLAAEFGRNAPDDINSNPFAPRNFGRCHVVFLLPNLQGVENGTLTVHAFESPTKPGEDGGNEHYTKMYRLEDSVHKAAQETASWIRRIDPSLISSGKTRSQ